MDKVEEVFRRLKAEGKIQIAKDVKNSKWGNTSYANKLSKTITYIARFNELSEENIEFCLLHEEDHFNIIEIKLHVYSIIAIVLFLLSIIWLIPRIFANAFAGACLGAPAMYLFLSFMHFLNIKVSQKYENLADDYAARNVSDLSKSISVFDRLSELNRTPENRIINWFYKGFYYFFIVPLGFDQSHPSYEERKKVIKKKFLEEAE